MIYFIKEAISEPKYHFLKSNLTILPIFADQKMIPSVPLKPLLILNHEFCDLLQREKKEAKNK